MTTPLVTFHSPMFAFVLKSNLSGYIETSLLIVERISKE